MIYESDNKNDIRSKIKKGIRGVNPYALLQ